MKNINLKNLLIDLTLLGIIMSVCWFLIGYYLQGEFLATNYPDWIYHAWRVKIISLYGGIPSWDHVWSNGLNHWVAYQYIQHYIILAFVKVFHISITKAMLLVTVIVFVAIRVLMYVFLRLLNIRAIIAFLAVILSLVFEQQWIAIGDFSIFVAMIIIPFYFYIWSNVLQKYEKLDMPIKERYIAEIGLAIFSGALWMFHPVVANSLSGLFFVTIGFRALKISWKYFFKILVGFFIGSSSFWLPYLTATAHYSNPIFSTSTFVRDTIAGDFFGLSMYFVAFISFSWLLYLVFANKVMTWAKVLLVYSSLYFFIIFLGKYDYLPSFILKFQISRVVPILALLLSFAFAGILNAAIEKKTEKVSKGFVIFILIISAIGITQAINLASVATKQPVKVMDSPITYFDDKPTPKGSIYVKKVATASFFGNPKLRFATSYNEHLLPQPLSMRYSSLLRSEIAYTSIPKSQVQLIKDYSLVLGVEYLILPSTSPLIKYLTQDYNEYIATFELVDIIETKERQFTILKNMEEINYAYLVDKDDSILKWKNDEAMNNITLEMSSYLPWDNIIKDTAQKIRNKSFVAINDFSFIDTNKLKVSLDSSTNLNNKSILITQSYSNKWKINDNKKAIKPSQSRFVVLDLNYLKSKKLIKVKNDRINIVLQNNWPFWHWPIQIFGILMIVMIFVLSIIRPKLFFIKNK